TSSERRRNRRRGRRILVKTETNGETPKPNLAPTLRGRSSGCGRSRQNLSEEMCEELSRNAADLTYENENLRRSVKPETNELEKPTKPSQVEMSTSPTPFNFYNQNQYQFFCWAHVPLAFQDPQTVVSSNEHYWGKIFNEEIFPASGFQVPASRSRVPASGYGSLPPGLGPCL
ncbi:hypothetical protein HID58_075823, partial [Brassica napus]